MLFGEEFLIFPGVHLLGRSWFVGSSPSVANIANYVYAGLIHQRRANVHEFSSLLAWMGRIEVLDGYVETATLPEPAS